MTSQISCPHCSQPINIGPQHAGQVIACPTCQGQIQIPAQQQQHAAQPTQQLPQQGTPPTQQQYGLPQAGGSQLPAPGLGIDTGQPAWSQKAAPRRKSPNMLPWILGGVGVLSVVIVAAVLIWLFVAGGGSLSSKQLAYLPDDANMIVHVDIAELLDSESWDGAKSALPIAGPQADEIFNLVDKLSGSVTVGMRFPDDFENEPEDLCGVLRTKNAVELIDEIPSGFKQMVSENEVEGETVHEMGEFAFCQIDKKTIVFGMTKTIRKVLERDGSASMSSDMKKVMKQANFSRDIAFAVALPEKAREKMRRDMRNSPFGKLGENEVPTGFVAHADLGSSSLSLDARILCEDSSGAKELKSKVEDALDKAKEEAPNEEARDALKSVRVSSSGSTVKISAKVSTSTFKGVPGLPF